MLAVAFTAAGSATAGAVAKPKQTYALRIGIDDGRKSVRAGDRLTYVTKVSNTGAVRTPDLLLTQTLVPGLELISSTPKGARSGDRITWTRALPTGETDQFSVTVEVGRLTGRPQRLAAVACASAKADRRPIVCASHLDLLRTTATESSGSRVAGVVPDWVVWCAVAGAGALLAASVMLFRRRRKARSTAASG
ncbi:DUF11 domain-containing protein [Actinoallomurus bryophytorum]|uniref:DUF11 domain-containing protein n=1 Tax=Actinoallomurus bryophytorum TaxID=1490222 RepID=UPI001639B1B2|nr:DUF11 domain-containing protein [Actinoallomurus bryophytorum]